jgi:low affinity Fe/Cu permease
MADTNNLSSHDAGTDVVGPPAPKRPLSLFERFARKASALAGKPIAFFTALAIVLVWLLTGPIFGFSDTWQLIINTGTTIITFLMVFLIQNTQNRDSEAIQVKLDELIRSIDGAHLALLDLEDLDDKDLERICREYRELAKQARKDLRAGKSDTDVREVGAAHRKELAEKRRQGKKPAG